MARHYQSQIATSNSYAGGGSFEGYLLQTVHPLELSVSLPGGHATPFERSQFRTWKSAPGAVKAAVISAIESGYRHIDCAAGYGNETEVGEAIADCIARGVVKREDLWVTSKLWTANAYPDRVGPALEKTLSDLKLDYLVRGRCCREYSSHACCGWEAYACICTVNHYTYCRISTSSTGPTPLRPARRCSPPRWKIAAASRE